jgi:hypothetical protein
MVAKRFLTSVADVFGYDESNNLLFTSKTLLDSSIEVTLGNTEVRGGRGNQLLYTYYHSNAMNVTLNDTQWNLQMLGATTGQNISVGSDVYTEETITLGGSGGGTVSGTPLSIDGSPVYGWVSQVSGATERVTFSGSTFASSSGQSGDVVCVRYYAADASARSITIPANAIPKVVRLVMEASLNSGDDSANKIGKVQFIVYRATLSGSFTLSMTSDGVSQTPLTAMALAYTDAETAACTSAPVYAKIIEVLDSANWYDNLVAIAVDGGSFALPTTTATKTLVVYGITSNPMEAPFIIDNAELSFTSGTTGVATAGLHTGLITGVADGTSLITVVVDDKTSIETQLTVTVPA